jgi:hypothetical protein
LRIKDLTVDRSAWPESIFEWRQGGADSQRPDFGGVSCGLDCQEVFTCRGVFELESSIRTGLSRRVELVSAEPERRPLNGLAFAVQNTTGD